MDRREFATVMTDSGSLIDAGMPEQALRRLTSFDEALAEQPDPKDYGWVFFYRFRAAFLAGDFEQALRLAEREPDRFTADLDRTNAAWMHSAAAEAAAELGLADTVVTMAQRCVELRLAMEEREGVLMAAASACTLLKRLGRCDLNGRFVDTLIELGVDSDEHRAYGYMELCLNIDATGDPARIEQLLAGQTWLTACDHDFARGALRFIQVSPTVAGHRAQ
jgi:hypothetical protein